MSMEGAENSEPVEGHVEGSAGQEKGLINTNDEGDPELPKENGLYGSETNGDNDDQLLEMVVELNLQNEYLRCQFEDLRNVPLDLSVLDQQYTAAEKDNEAYHGVKELHEKIESLNKELSEERQTRGAAEEALKHLQAASSEADEQVQELSAKLAEAQQKMDQALKERDEKYSELDTKFNRLHKRAKQRIQEVQKEKEDVEAQLREVNEKADNTSSQLSTLQQELERTRQQANEALKTMDMERQQLRSANNKLRDNLEDMRRSLAPKENAIEALQQSVSEKEQMLEDMRQLLQAADEKSQASVAEMSLKHQKKIESLEAQISDALADGSKARDTISSLRALVAEKESKIADMEAASTGEVARLKAAMETVKGELTHLKNEHEKERESWEGTIQTLKAKLETAENNCIRSEIEVAKMRSQLESTLSVQTRLISTKDADLQAAREEVNRLEAEFGSYKARAHALLQRKDAELAASRDNEQVKALEEALKEVEKEVSVASSERDKALQDLRDALANHVKELGARDEALTNAQQELKSMNLKFKSALSSHQSEKESWELNLQNVEETWRLRCETLKAQNEVSSGEHFQKDLEDLKLQYKKLKEEHDSFRDLADKMIEEKDKEIARLLDDNENLHRSLDSRPVEYNDNYDTGSQKADGPNPSLSAAEQQILILARQQAQREEELAQSQRYILALQEELEELESENRLHAQQEAMLKEELRDMERMQKREGVDLTYLKNVILKLLQTGEVEALLPVIGMLLQFSPEEMQKSQQAYRSQVPASPSSDASGSGGGLSLFSRFSFS